MSVLLLVFLVPFLFVLLGLGFWTVLLHFAVGLAWGTALGYALVVVVAFNVLYGLFKRT